MDPTNLLLIVALGNPNFHVRNNARMHLEDQGIAAFNILKLYERDKDPEVASSCKTIKDRIVSKYIHAWAENQKFYALGEGKLRKDGDNIYYNPYYIRASKQYHKDYNIDCYHYHRCASKLWAIDRLLAGETWESVTNELVGDDMLTAENIPSSCEP